MSDFVHIKSINNNRNLICFLFSLQAAEKLKITATELTKLQICDGVIPVIILFLFPLKLFVLDGCLFYAIRNYPGELLSLKRSCIQHYWELTSSAVRF